MLVDSCEIRPRQQIRLTHPPPTANRASARKNVTESAMGPADAAAVRRVPAARLLAPRRLQKSRDDRYQSLGADMAQFWQTRSRQSRPNSRHETTASP